MIAFAVICLFLGIGAIIKAALPLSDPGYKSDYMTVAALFFIASAICFKPSTELHYGPKCDSGIAVLTQTSDGSIASTVIPICR